MASKQSPFCSQRPDRHFSLHFLASPFPVKPAALALTGEVPPAAAPLLLVQFEDSHEGFGGQLNGAQGTHFLLACSHTDQSVWVPSFFNARAEVNSALRKFSALLRIYGASAAPLCGAPRKAEENVLTLRPA